MLVKELREELENRGLPKSGRKDQLVKRLMKAMKEVGEEDETVLDMDLPELIEANGTKLAHLVVYLRKLLFENKENRVIIFSQYDTFLKKMGNLLTQHGITNLFVEGNVYRKSNTIASFKGADPDNVVRVIMLSLQNTAAGTNLIKATHIILMDPVSGSKKEAQATEAQAIGRAHRQGQKNEVTVVRFVIKDTLEHEYYLRNNADNALVLKL